MKDIMKAVSKVHGSRGIFIFFLLLTSLIFAYPLNYTDEQNEVIDLKVLSSYWDLTGSRIHIDGNWSATASTFDWCSGNGTINDPYIIENVTINALGIGSCLFVNNSNVFFIIKNCKFYNTGIEDLNAGITLFNVNNSRIINNNCSSNNMGIFLIGCFNTISDNICSSIDYEEGMYEGYNNYGICLGPGFNNTISNNKCHSNYYGIGMHGCFDSISSKNNCSSNYIGIAIGWNSNNNTIADNLCSSNIYGIDMGLCSNNKILRNNVNYNSLFGMTSHWSDWNTISQNNFSNNHLSGLRFLESDFNSIKNNIMNNNNESGLFIFESSNNFILRNTLNHNKLNGILLESLIPEHRNYCQNNIILENFAFNNSHGIKLNNTRYNDLMNNTLDSNRVSGIQLENSFYTNISNNSIINNYCGINISNSLNNDLISNTVNNNYYGLSLKRSHYNSIIDNFVFNNQICIREESGCIDNIFENNKCSESEDEAMRIIIIVSILIGIIGIMTVLLIYQLRKSR